MRKGYTGQYDLHGRGWLLGLYRAFGEKKRSVLTVGEDETGKIEDSKYI